MSDDPLREAYAHQLKALRALRREIARRDRLAQDILDAVRESDEASTSFGAATPCSDVHPDYESCSHECYVPPDEVEHIERCGE